MTQYASQTSVPVERSRAEIEQTLMRYGATHFAYMLGPEKAVIEFLANDRRLRFTLPLPSQSQRAFTHSARGLRDRAVAVKLWEQACRQRWRALALAIKAKLESVECHIAEFEDEFLAHIVDPATGMTVGEVLRPQIAASYDGRPVQLLLTGPDTDH